MSNEIRALSAMPLKPEESWRRTDPEMFFLRNDEVLSANGKALTGEVLKWKIQCHELSISEMETKILSLADGIANDFLQWIRDGDFWNRLNFVTIGAGTVEYVKLKNSIAGAVAITTKQFSAVSVIPGSMLSLATSERLASSVGEEIVVSVSTSDPQIEPIVFVSQSKSQLPQAYSAVKIIAATQAKFSLVMLENFVPFSMRRHEVILQDGAKVTELWTQISTDSNSKSRNLSERVVRMAANSEFLDAQIFAPAGNVRCISNVIIEGENAKAKSGAAVVAAGNSRFDYEPWQEHQVQKSSTGLKAKFLIFETAKAVFQGLIRVEKPAMQTVAVQENKNLLIGKRSRVESLPRLEILPNDVMCKHGSATGQLDARHIYYLGTRGFSEDEARAMIVRGFVRDGLGALPFEHPLQILADVWLSRVLLGLDFV